MLVVLGVEHDAEVWRRARAALDAAGVRVRSANWGVGGSQEVGTLVFELDGRELTLRAETYAGATLTGDEAQVSRVQALFNRSG